MSAVFLGPLHTTALSASCRREPTDITLTPPWGDLGVREAKLSKGRDKVICHAQDRLPAIGRIHDGGSSHTHQFGDAGPADIQIHQTNLIATSRWSGQGHAQTG